MKRFNDFITELNRFEKEKGKDTKTIEFCYKIVKSLH